MHGRAGGFDGEIPAIAGDIPEKPVVILVKTKLAICRVGERVNMLAGAREGVGVAKVDAFAVELVLNAERFGNGITGGGEHLETDDVAVVVWVAVCRGEIAENVVANLLASTDDRDGFCNLERSVVLERHIAVVVEDAFRWSARGKRREQTGARHEQETNFRGGAHRDGYIQCRGTGNPSANR